MLKVDFLVISPRIGDRRPGAGGGSRNCKVATPQEAPGPVKDNTGIQNVETNLSASYKDFKDELLTSGEKHYFTEICTQAMGNPAQACSLSGLSRSRLYHFLNKHGISLADYK